MASSASLSSGKTKFFLCEFNKLLYVSTVLKHKVSYGNFMIKGFLKKLVQIIGSFLTVDSACDVSLAVLFVAIN
jgi:hypothetical protein